MLELETEIVCVFRKMLQSPSLVIQNSTYVQSTCNGEGIRIPIVIHPYIMDFQAELRACFPVP